MQTSVTGWIVVTLCLLLVQITEAAEPASEEPPKLLGRCTVDELEEEPYSEWFRKEYDRYVPHADVVQALRQANRNGISMRLFFGTWCGDSRREVPRILKVLDRIGLAEGSVDLIAVDTGEGVQKQSPDGEERGLEIYRVPTLIVDRGGAEIARMVEFPVLSLERDLLAILSGAPYEPNYRSYPIVRRWFEDGLLADGNVNPGGLANEIRSLVASEGELAASASVLLERGDSAEAVKLAEVNCVLFRNSSRCYERLAEARLRAGDHEGTHEAASRALRLNTDADRVETLVELLERSRQTP